MVIFISFGLNACDSERDSNDFNITADVQITSFSINGASGTIDQNSGKINFQLPYGTSLIDINISYVFPALS
jgi:hypothetical protein